MMPPRLIGLLLTATLCLSCGGSGDGGGTVEPGATRLGWDQGAADATELGRLQFVIYIDNVRTELPGASCSTPSGNAGFPCVAALPAMASGQHTIQLASYLVSDVLLESARSASLVITVSGGGATTAGAATADATPAPRVPAPSSVRDLTTADGARLHTAVVAAVAEPSALAIAADRTLVVGDRRGRVAVVRGGASVGETELGVDGLSGGGILDVVLDADFPRSHLLYVLDTVPGDAPTFRLVRYREVGGRLGERAVLLDGVAASPVSPSGALAFGADGRLYVALDDGGDAERASRSSSYSGKVIRLTVEGLTPADQPAATPVYATGIRAPRSLSWDTPSASLWLADTGTARATRLRTGDRRTTVTSVPLPLPHGPASIAVYRGALIPELAGHLLVASIEDAPSLLRVRLTDAGTVAASEPLTLLGSGSIRAVKVGPDGAIYALTDDAVLRVAPR